MARAVCDEEARVKVKAIMTPAPETCTLETTLAKAANLMWEGDCGVLPVVDDGELVGIVTDRDMFIAVGTRDVRAAHVRVGAVATRRVATCGPEDAVETALAIMKGATVRRLPVIDHNGTVVGIVSINDIAFAAGVDPKHVVDALRAICERHRYRPERAEGPEFAADTEG
jgi:CBS domain-containing protein